MVNKVKKAKAKKRLAQKVLAAKKLLIHSSLQETKTTGSPHLKLHASPANLAEVVKEIKRQNKECNELKLSIEVPSKEIKPQITAYKPSLQPYLPFVVGPYGSTPQADQSVYSRSGYSSEKREYAPQSAIQAGELSYGDLAKIQEDAKLRNWGCGGSGKHIPLKAQEAYAVIKSMSSTFAWNTILYDLALH